MLGHAFPRLKGVYGVDAPYVPALFLGFSVVTVTLAARYPRQPWLWVIAAVFVASLALYLQATLRGKFVLWHETLAGLHLAADARVLDVGCGRGLVLLQAALATPDGLAVGVDLWRGQDQSGNSAAATMQNAQLNGVAGRVGLVTGDMTALPHPDAAFDCVFASLAVQNIKDRDLRRTAVSEMLRVTRPGGALRIMDMQYCSQYEQDLVALGAANVTVRNLGWRGWFGNPFYATRLVSATKA